jgi:hypothetical protein
VAPGCAAWSPARLLPGLPGRIFQRHASRARPVSRRDGRCLVGKEYAVLRVGAGRDVSQSTWAIQSAVDAQLAVATQCALDLTFVLVAVAADELELFDLRPAFQESVAIRTSRRGGGLTS